MGNGRDKPACHAMLLTGGIRRIRFFRSIRRHVAVGLLPRFDLARLIVRPQVLSATWAAGERTLCGKNHSAATFQNGHGFLPEKVSDGPGPPLLFVTLSFPLHP